MRLRLEEGELRHLLQLQEAEGAAQGEAQVQPKQEEQGEAQEQAQRLQEVQAKTQAEAQPKQTMAVQVALQEEQQNPAGQAEVQVMPRK